MRRTILLTSRALLALTVLVGASACEKSGSVSTNPGDESAETNPAAGGGASAQSATKAATLVDLANTELGHGRYQSARKRAEEALASNPKNVQAHAILGQAKMREGDYDAALEAFKNGSEIDPADFSNAIAYARALQMRGSHEEAIAVLDAQIASESKGWVEKECDASSQCTDGGICDQATNMCQPTPQISPRYQKLLSYYAQLDVDKGLRVADEIFVGVGGTEIDLAFARVYAGFMRPLAGKGPFFQIEGESGESSLYLDVNTTERFIELSIDGKPARGMVVEFNEECRISPEFAEKLGAKEVGKSKLYGEEVDRNIYIIPSVKIGGLVVKNVPAIVAEGFGTDIQLGRQFLYSLGSYTYDFGADKFRVAATSTGAPEGAGEAPLLFVDGYIARFPVTKMSVDAGQSDFWAYLPGYHLSGVSVSALEYYRAGHRQEDVLPPDDAERQLKAVIMDSVRVGGLEIKGISGAVLAGNPADPLLQTIANAGFGAQGMINGPLLKRWTITFDLKRGRIYLQG